MLKRVVTMMAIAALGVATATAQTAAPAKPAAPASKSEAATAKAPPEPPAMALNIRIEVSITDQSGSGTPARKLVTMIAGDRQNTNIRSSANVPFKNMSGSYNYRTVTINVDARPSIVPREPSRVQLSLGLEYIPKMAETSLPVGAGSAVADVEPGMASFSERLGLILDSGKPMIISQAADPTSDRKITVEVTATILK